MMQLELSVFIEADLDAIAAFIAEDNPRRAVTFLLDIGTKFRMIQQHPLIYRLRTDIGEDARMATVGNYAILFRIAESTVRIERVVYAGRDLSDVFDMSSEP